MRRLLALNALLVFAGMLGCDPSGSSLPDPPPLFSRDIQPTLQGSCATSGCHDAATRAEGLALDTWAHLFEGSEHGAMVIPFRSDKSHLIYHINADSTVAPVAEPSMPPGSQLHAKIVSTFMRWIDMGALDDDGNAAFETAPMGRVFVTNQAEDQVAVIDRATNLVTRLVRVGILDDRTSPPESPHNVVIDPQGVFYFVNLIVSGEIRKFRVSNNAYVERVVLDAGSSPAQIVLSSDGSTGYVSNFDLLGNFRRVQAFSTSSMQITKNYTDQRMWASHGVQLMHNGRYLWSCNQISDNLTVIDLQTDSVAIVKADPSVPDVPSSPTSQFGPYQLVFSPDDLFAYVTCRTSNEVRIFNTATRSLVTAVPVGVQPLILDITPDGQFVYVANRGTGASPSTSVSVINTTTKTIAATIPDVGTQPHGVAVTPDGQFVYVSTENLSGQDSPHHPLAGSKTPSYVAVIAVATNTVVKRIEVGSFGAGIAITP